MSEVLVSISCITYNHAPYIRECIEGFLMQKTNFAFEILIHDDASTDGNQDLIREYELKYPNIIKPIYRMKNLYSQGYRGMNQFNYERAEGKYIALCEGDDYWTDPLKLQKQVDFLESNPKYSMCFHNANRQYNNTNKYKLFNNLRNSKEIYLDNIVHKWIIPTASILFRKEVLIDYPEWTKEIYSGDFTLSLLCYKYGSIYYINEIMSLYRVNTTGSSLTAKVKGNASFVINQHIKLLNYYNESTNFIYDTIISTRLRELKKEFKFYVAREKGFLKMILNYPLIFLSKTLKKIKSYVR